MTSSRPYILRALYEWLNDNRLTPYILVNAQLPEVYVPKEHINDGKIVLNIANDAVYDLLIGNRELEFRAKFSGIARHISMPIAAVMAIYAKENGVGMVFGEEPGGDTPPDDSNQPIKTKKETPTHKKSHLKIVK